MVAANGEKEAEAWAKGMAKNFARPPQGGDRDQIKAVAEGLADACLSNSYYLGVLLNSTDPAERKAAEKVRMVFPNQDGRGAHCNVSAAGVINTSKRVEAAKTYLEFLVGDEVQQKIANATYEHPVMMELGKAAQLGAWGPFKADKTTFGKLGEFSTIATRIFDRSGWK